MQRRLSPLVLARSQTTIHSFIQTFIDNLCDRLSYINPFLYPDKLVTARYSQTTVNWTRIDLICSMCSLLFLKKIATLE